MAALDDATAALASAVALNTTATNDLIAAYASAAPTPAQVDAITAQTTALTANTTAITNLLTPPAPVAEPAPEPAA